MKKLFIGGVKSGKSRLAEKMILQHQEKPLYLATTEFFDKELAQRISQHQKDRKDTFITIEEPLDLAKTIREHSNPVLIECVTMWLNNMLYHQKDEREIFKELDLVLSLPNEIVFVLNDVGSGVIPTNELARRFVDLSGKISQKLAEHCDEVYHVIAGLQQRLK